MSNYNDFFDDNNEENSNIENNEYDYYPDFISVTLSVEEAEKLIETSNLGVSFEIKEKRKIDFPENKHCIIIIAEKFFYMVNSYVSATIIIDNADGNTKVQVCTSGAGNGLIGYDHGREEKFYNQILNIFRDYII